VPFEAALKVSYELYFPSLIKQLDSSPYGFGVSWHCMVLFGLTSTYIVDKSSLDIIILTETLESATNRLVFQLFG